MSLPKISRRRVFALAAQLAAASSLAACAQEATLTQFVVQPSEISPNADGTADVTRVSYTLRRSATVSMYLADSSGQRHYFREGLSRAAGSYTVDFGGVIDGRMLADGAYRYIIEAQPLDRGQLAVAERPLTLRGADISYPEIIGLTVYPDVFTPNRDGIADRVRITYDLNKEVRRIDIHLVGPDGVRYAIPDDKLRLAGAAGRHEHDYDAGIDLGAEPPAPGQYRVALLVEDAAGNRASDEASLTIEAGGVPRASIVKAGTGAGVEWTDTVVAVGGLVDFRLQVKNIGSVPIRTHGPEPGTVYDITENYNTLGAYLSSGAFRVGVDFEGNTAGHAYPYRWQIGKLDQLTKVTFQGQDFYYLAPGQTVEVTGGILVSEAPHLRAPRFWAGLIHEDVEYVPGEEYVNPTAIQIGF